MAAPAEARSFGLIQCAIGACFPSCSTLHQRGGQLCKSKELPTDAAEDLELQAGLCLLKAVRIPQIETLLTPRRWQAFASLITHDDLGVRRTILLSMSKNLIRSRLPTRYIACFAMAALDSDR